MSTTAEVVVGNVALDSSVAAVIALAPQDKPTARERVATLRLTSTTVVAAASNVRQDRFAPTVPASTTPRISRYQRTKAHSPAAA